MATYLNIVNAVQRRLRSTETANVNTTSYSELLGDFVNQAKREVEDAWPWLVLQGEHSFNTVASTASYTLTGFNERSRVQRVHNTTTANEVMAVDWYKMDKWNDFVTMSEDQPSWWRLDGMTSGEWDMEFLPVPDAVYAMKVYGITPQDDLTTDATVVLAPYLPITLGAYLLAVSERGDDAGLSEQRAQREYQSALSDAIALDNDNRHAGLSSDWHIWGDTRLYS